MGRQKNTIISATVGNVIYYTRWNKGYIRQKPAVVHMADVAIANAGIFGQAVTTATAIRKTLLPLITRHMNRPLMYRLNEAVRQCITAGIFDNPTPQILTPLTGFTLNKATSFTERFKKTITITKDAGNTLHLNIPALQPATNITAPAKTKLVYLQAIALCADLHKGTIIKTGHKEWMLPYTNEMLPPQQWNAEGCVLPQCISIVAAGLCYSLTGMAAGVYDERPAWIPADILWAEWGGI